MAAVLFFSIIPPKRDLYLLPAYPAAALLAARAFARASDDGRLGRWVGAVGPALMALAGVLLIGVGSRMSEIPGAWWRAPVAGLPLVAGAVLSLRSLRRPRRWANAAIWSWCLSFTLLAVLVFPLVNPLKSGRILAQELAELPQRPTSIPCIRVHSEAYRFYAGVPTVDAASLEPFLERDGEDFVGLVLEKRWQAMAPEQRARYRVIHRRRVGGKQIVVLGAADPELQAATP